MLLYCYVKNGQISEPRSLPSTYLNISNFNLLEEDIVNIYNFYRFLDAAKPPYDEKTQKVDRTLALENNFVVPVYSVVDLSPEEISSNLNSIKMNLVSAVESYLDSKVAERDYKSVLHACSYVESTIPQYRAEALAVVAWRDSVWATAYAIQNAVLNGERNPPDEAELLAELPELGWLE
jgi:hypothetical protein